MMKINTIKLAVAMAKLCVKQEELARMAGVNTMTISRAKNGQGSVHLSTIGKIAKALNVRVEDLLEDEPGVAAPIHEN
jgi:DNA-binding Xre family transcriptional regulator